MAAPKITSTYLRNEKPPGDDIPDDAPSHIKDQFAGAEFCKQKIAELTKIANTRKGTDKITRDKARKDIQSLRLLLPLLQCPEASIKGFSFLPDDRHRYKSSRETENRIDFVERFQFLIDQANKLRIFWQGSQPDEDDDEPVEYSTPQYTVQIDIENTKTTPTSTGKGKANAKRPNDAPESPSPGPSTPGPSTLKKTKTSGRNKIARDAQKTAKDWYGPRCIFTHTTYPIDGAHIVPHHISGSSIRRNTFEDTLSMFFPGNVTSKITELLSGNLFTNILPLDKSTHNIWDTCRMVIRPLPSKVPAEEDDGRSMEIQFLRLTTEDPVSRNSPWDVRTEQQDEDLGSLGDSRRRHDTDEKPPIRIQTGDVILLETTDPDKYPLPSRELLSMAYHCQLLRLSLKARGALETIFQGPPPDVDGDAIRSRQFEEPSSCFEDVVHEAIRQRVISREDGWKWIVESRELDEELQRRKLMEHISEEEEEEEEVS
ncbi:hypothetical protein PG996_011473 [Apiospora saccharicola]|uniref:HNH nuclease domain-containing protein n=1 Tax=Apiospora saccharicola TaxID=335842 RepID=A0ABR1UF69_9PEZI